MSAVPGATRVSAVVVAMADSPALAAALASLVAQAHRPLELVLFGNGAPLPAPEWVREHGVTLVTGSSERNLGVAGGRNAASALATGDALLFLDDDAVLRPRALESAVGALSSGPDVGAVAFRIVAPGAGAPALWYYPYDRGAWSTRAFQAPWVIGCGNLIWRADYERLGGLWDGYFREVEEIDISWRLIDAGRVIRYEPGAVVEHPERTKRHLRHSVASNLLMWWRLLPPGLAARRTLITVPLWTVRALRHGELADLRGGLADARAGLPRAWGERAPLRPATVRYLRRVHAPQSAGKRLQWSLRPLSPPEPLAGQPV